MKRSKEGSSRWEHSQSVGDFGASNMNWGPHRDADARSVPRNVHAPLRAWSSHQERSSRVVAPNNTGRRVKPYLQAVQAVVVERTFREARDVDVAHARHQLLEHPALRGPRLPILRRVAA